MRLDFYFPIPAISPSRPETPRSDDRGQKHPSFPPKANTAPDSRHPWCAEPITRARAHAPPKAQNPPGRRHPSLIPVTTAGGSHLFPFRTQKLSLPAPMVLPGVPVGEWVVAGMMLRWTGERRLKTGKTDSRKFHGIQGRTPAPAA